MPIAAPPAALASQSPEAGKAELADPSLEYRLRVGSHLAGPFREERRDGQFSYAAAMGSFSTESPSPTSHLPSPTHPLPL